MLCFNIYASAQDYTLQNGTDCKFEIRVAYDTDGDCKSNGFIDTGVSPNTSSTFNIPDGAVILVVKGRPTDANGACPFHVGVDCSAYGPVANVDCDVSCGDYTATFIEGVGVQFMPG